MAKSQKSKWPDEWPVEAKPGLVRIMSIHEVLGLTGYSRSGLLKLCDQGRFPEPTWIESKYAPKRRGFYEDEVQAWLAANAEPEREVAAEPKPERRRPDWRPSRVGVALRKTRARAATKA